MHQPDEVERYLKACAAGEAATPPDAVKRIKDAMDLFAVTGERGWAVFALADGKCDHIAYPSWSAAVRSTKHDRDRFMYIEITPDGMPSHRHAAAPLHYARTLHRGGFRIPSPDWRAGPLASSMPFQARDRRLMTHQLASGRPLLPTGFAMSNLPTERGRH